MKTSVSALAVLAAACLPSLAYAADADSCRTIRMSDPGWTDITSTNALFGTVAEALGYEQDVETLAVPVTFESLKNDDIDVFLGNWMPAQSRFIEPLTAAGDIVVVRPNLEGVRYTLAVPNYVSDEGVTSVDNLKDHADEFGGEIYGIDPGSPGNAMIQAFIDGEGLDGWNVVESSEAGMLSQVERRVSADDWVVFLAWEPNPMNTKYDLTYLSGGETYFGENFGSATIYTVTRSGYGEECPNVQRLLDQMVFNVDIENRIMAAITDDGADARDAAEAELKADPALIDSWLAGVTTFDGEDGAAAVKAELGL